MIDRPSRWRVWTLGLMVVAQSLQGCGGAAVSSQPGAPGDEGGVVEPENEAQRRVLKELDALPAGRPRRVGSVTVVAEPPYFAGSGRTCRGLTFTSAGGRQSARLLACKEGRAWVYVPNVLVAPAGTSN